MANMFQNFTNYWNDLFKRPILELNYVQVIILVIIAFLGYKLLKYLLKILKLGLKVTKRTVDKFSIKHRCERTQCRHCGRTLDKCVCASNKNHGYFYRYRHHRQETKAIRNKQKELKK